MRSLLRRWVFRIALALLLGAITTVAVAWSLAFLIAVNQPFDEVEPVEAKQWLSDIDWYVWREDRIGTTFVSTMRLKMKNEQHELRRSEPSPDDLLPSWSGLRQISPEFISDDVVSEVRSAEARGWPMLALWRDAGGKLSRRPIEPSGGIILPLENRAIDYERALPLYLLWPGILVDSVFYATLWFAVLAVPVATRRAIRRTRGRCPRCGYNLRGEFDDGCPECGWNRTNMTSK